MARQTYSIVIVSSEFSPFAKTGGLGDMVAALAAGLAHQGQKVGIHFADEVNTVSPTYALEIKTSVGGSRLAPAIAKKGEQFLGVLNGVDYDTWSP